MRMILFIGKCIAEAIYFVIKLFPAGRQIVIISRQSDVPSFDIELLSAELENRGEKVIVACKFIDPGLAGHIRYCFHMMKQMYLFATSKVVVLDGYCILASMLHHKKNMKIVQMWHALGSFKQFGYSILDKEEGSRSRISKAMRMHRNYDYIITSSEASRKNFAEAFDYPLDAFEVMSLPRVDALTDSEYDARKRREIFEAYPELKERKNILYAPTFRKNTELGEYIERLISALDNKEYNIVVKLHPLSECDMRSRAGVIIDREFSSMDMLCVSDYVITDYSAITYEAALKGKPLFFYAFDLDEYEDGRSFYLDYRNDMPGKISGNADDIMRAIRENDHSLEKVKAFAEKYVEKREKCTAEMADFLVGLLWTDPFSDS